jgi:hypothetical protein
MRASFIWLACSICSPQVAGLPNLGASGCAAGRRRDQDGHRGPRRTHCDRRGDFPYRSRITYTAKDFTKLCCRLGVVQLMGRSGRASITPPWRRSSPPSNTRCCPGITTTPAPRPALSLSPVQDFYNVKRRHSSAALLAPDDHGRIAATQADAASMKPSTISGKPKGRTQISWSPVCNHAPMTGRIGNSLLAISE